MAYDRVKPTYLYVIYNSDILIQKGLWLIVLYIQFSSHFELLTSKITGYHCGVKRASYVTPCSFVDRYTNF